jgi:4-hydroxyphenylacetate 3-monooxygenase
MPTMRTGADYRDSLRDGRRIWILGEGQVDDVTTHPTTRAMVDEYVGWYDRHFDPKWQDIVLTPTDSGGCRSPVGYMVPRTPDDLSLMGRCFSATTFLSAGNITHTPAYGHLIALGVLHAVCLRNASPQQRVNAEAYRALIARTGRFLTFAAGAATIGYRLRENPAERAALRIVKETDGGLVIRGKIGMHTSPAFAEDVYIGANNGVDFAGHRATLVVAVNAPGVTVICRKPAARDSNPFSAPLSNRYDELDGQMWLDDVLVPWDRVFLTEPNADPVARWLFWHQLYCWLSKAEFTLGLALACAHAMGLASHDATIDYLLDLITDVQTVRSCQTAAELDPEFTAEEHCSPNHCHVAAGSLAMLKARPLMGEILRILPGSSLVVAPTDKDLAEPALAAGLEESFAGGGYTAAQRAALLQMAWDHVGSALDHRESVYELHANGGAPAWRGRLRRSFNRYNELANGVLAQLGLPMPKIDLQSIRNAPLAPRRLVTPNTPSSKPPQGEPEGVRPPSKGRASAAISR